MTKIDQKVKEVLDNLPTSKAEELESFRKFKAGLIKDGIYKEEKYDIVNYGYGSSLNKN